MRFLAIAKFFLIGSLLLTLAICFQVSVPQKEGKRSFLSPPENLKYFTLGYNDVIASVFWIRLLQDFEYCEGGRFTEKDFVAPSEETTDGISKVLDRKLHASKCNKGWVYSMLNSITDIQPRFKIAYDTGAVLLSVLVDDREGARLIYEKGLAIYPDDWEMNFRAAYHYLWELQQPERAAILFNKAATLGGGPAWIAALSAALFTRVGNAKFAKIILEDALSKRPTGIGAERIKVRLDEVNKVLQEGVEKSHSRPTSH
jgi:tetratricopeptide (TPR) repeat protein